MKIVDINCGEYVTRPHWKNLVITRSATTFKLMYVSYQNSNKGEIKEEGTHHELIQQNGIYTKLCSMQEL